ncbi:MAG: SdpI family protein [Acidimicrobiales bacterium]
MVRAIRSGIGGVIVFAIGRMASEGRLPRNPFVGIRIPSTMRSDAAWFAGHSAAAPALKAAGLGPIGTAIIVAATRPNRDVETSLYRLGVAWLVGGLAVATFQAHRAAQAENTV